MKKYNIYLVFSKTGTILSRVLSMFSETKYVHSAISFDNSFTHLYSFGRKNPYNPLSGGFVVENFLGGVYSRFPRSECHITKLEVTQEQYYSLKSEVETFMEKEDKYKYNFLGLFGIVFNIPIKRQDYYFCSQFVSEMLMKSGIYSSNKPPELIRTDDLFCIDNQEFYYSGFVNQCFSFKQLYNFTLKL